MKGRVARLKKAVEHYRSPRRWREAGQVRRGSVLDCDSPLALFSQTAKPIMREGKLPAHFGSRPGCYFAATVSGEILGAAPALSICTGL